MTRLALALLLLPGLAGCGFYGSYSVLREDVVRAEERSLRLLSAAEIMWTEAVYNGLKAEIAVRDPLANQDAGTRETVTVLVGSSSDPATQSLTLTETGGDTGVFRGSVALVRRFDAATGALVAAASGQLLVDADQEAARLEAVYAAPRGRLKAEVLFIEAPMFFGTARDLDGVTPLPGATVTLERGGKAIRTTRARADGTYAFYGLESGSYAVVVQKDGELLGQSLLVNL